MPLLSLTLILIFIMDPLGNVASFMELLKDQPSKKRAWTILREMGLALVFMLLFSFLGEHLQSLLQLSDVTIHIATGTVLFLAAIGILFPGARSVRRCLPADPNPFLVPLAIPLIAGPSLLATVMLYSQQESAALMLTALFIAWAVSVGILLMGKQLTHFLGKNGLIAAERLVAMVLVMIAIQRFFEGITLFVEQLSATS